MDYFKKKARETLLDDQEFDNEPADEVNTISLGNAYKNLKNAIKNPVVVYSYPENKPNYMKMTFSMSRIANQGERFMDLAKLKGSNLGPSGYNQSELNSISGTSQLKD